MQYGRKRQYCERTKRFSQKVYTFGGGGSVKKHAMYTQLLDEFCTRTHLKKKKLQKILSNLDTLPK